MTDMTISDAGFRTEPTLSWSAILAGSLVAIASSVLLTLLAAGFGYNLAASALMSRQSLDVFTPELGAGAVAIQVVSAALGGYLAGRLRHDWSRVHIDEAHFRDTAQGLIVWALSTVLGLILVAEVIAPYAASLAPDMATVAPSAAEAARAAQIAAQSAFFSAIGMLLSGLTAAVAARLGGLQSEAWFRKGR